MCQAGRFASYGRGYAKKHPQSYPARSSAEDGVLRAGDPGILAEVLYSFRIQKDMQGRGETGAAEG